MRMEKSAPFDKESALQCLNGFMENAMNTKLKENFNKAVKILHGPCYIMKEDSSFRMYFYCVNCSKDLNSIKSLNEHATSEGHLKHFDAKTQAERLKRNPDDGWRYSSDSLQFKIQNSTCAIVGLQMVEVYENSKGHIYCKCILCGAHGKVDDMYKHLIGDKHTDKYINSRRVLKSRVMKSEERKHLREIIRDEEDSFVHKIRTFRSDSLYPFKWKLERMAKFDSKQRMNCEPLLEMDDYSSLAIECERIDDVLNKFRNPSPPRSMDEKGFGIFSYDFLANLLLKSHFIIQTHLLEETGIYSNADFGMVLKLTSYVLHLLHYSNKSSLEEVPENRLKRFIDQKTALRSCLGYIHERLIPYYEEKTGVNLFPKRY